MDLVIFENKNLIVLDKPASVLSVPSRHSDEDQRKVLYELLGSDAKKGLYPVHRLDFEVSGLIVFAKNLQAQKILSKIFESRNVKKYYTAWTDRGLTNTLELNKPIIWKNNLVRGKKRVFDAPYGKPAITNAIPLAIEKWNNLEILNWSLNPETGRPHQLRFHLSNAGFPILGDRKYGSKFDFLPGSIALRAQKLEFINDAPLSNLEIPTILQAIDSKSYWQKSMA